MNWFFISILSGLCFSGSRVLSRILLKKQGNALAFTSIHDFIAGIILIPFLFFNFQLPENQNTWFYFLGIVIFAFLSDWLAFVALKKIDVSLYQIINQSRHVFMLIGGLIIFSEAITYLKVIAIILIIIGVFISLYEKSKMVINKGVIITLLSTLSAIVAFIFAKATVNDFSETAAASFELLLIGIISFGFLRFNPEKIKQELSVQKWGLIISGVLFGGFEVLLFFALKIGEASRVIPVTQVSLIITVLAGIIILKERAYLFQKIMGTLIIALGIVLIYF